MKFGLMHVRFEALRNACNLVAALGPMNPTDEELANIKAAISELADDFEARLSRPVPDPPGWPSREAHLSPGSEALLNGAAGAQLAGLTEELG